MTNQIHASPHTRVIGIALRSPKVMNLQRELPDTNGVLDGSAEGLNGFLQELVEMMGLSGSPSSVPVLELHLGDVSTMTSVSTAGNGPCLSVTALLPRIKQSEFHPLSSVPVTMTAAVASEYEFLWHADEGRYVVIRRIAIYDLIDERHVMDAILETADEAAKWFSAVCAYLDTLK